MSSITVTDRTVEVRFTRREKVAGLLRDVSIPRSAITDVTVVDDGVEAVQGIRAPGLGLPGRKVGTWRGQGRRELVCVRRGEPAVRLQLEGQHHSSALLGVPDAAALADRLARHVG